MTVKHTLVSLDMRVSPNMGLFLLVKAKFLKAEQP